jgi:hypothetical protein
MNRYAIARSKCNSCPFGWDECWNSVNKLPCDVEECRKKKEHEEYMKKVDRMIEHLKK